MTTSEFYKYAVLAAEERGFKNPKVTTISGTYEGDLLHSCALWNPKKKTFISSGMRNNPIAAISAFKDAIDFDAKEYSAYVEDVDLK